MRPALGNELVLITVSAERSLRVLDFTRLDQARSGKTLSYFQPDFIEEIKKRTFLRKLHRLISQPVVPGHEADYLIPQTMTEFLAHVHEPPFDGVLFASAQRAEGTNVVLFPKPGTLDESMGRRSVYFMIKRSTLVPSMQIFDSPEPLVSVGNRPATTIAPQALLFMNSPHVRAAAKALAVDELRNVSKTEDGVDWTQVGILVYSCMLTLKPTTNELSTAA